MIGEIDSTDGDINGKSYWNRTVIGVWLQKNKIQILFNILSRLMNLKSDQINDLDYSEYFSLIIWTMVRK